MNPLKHSPLNTTPFHCIIFYRWYTDNGRRERGRIMARLIGEILKSMGVRVWLDQHQMSRDTSRAQVFTRIAEAFQASQAVLILAAPGDWDRFLEDDDIHRWEWEISLSSNKPVWVLQYETSPGMEILGCDLQTRLAVFSKWLAILAGRRDVHVRAVTTENIDSVLTEVAGYLKGPSIATRGRGDIYNTLFLESTVPNMHESIVVMRGIL